MQRDALHLYYITLPTPFVSGFRTAFCEVIMVDRQPQLTHKRPLAWLRVRPSVFQHTSMCATHCAHLTGVSSPSLAECGSSTHHLTTIPFRLCWLNTSWLRPSREMRPAFVSSTNPQQQTCFTLTCVTSAVMWWCCLTIYYRCCVPPLIVSLFSYSLPILSLSSIFYSFCVFLSLFLSLLTAAAHVCMITLLGVACFIFVWKLF